MKHLIFDRGVAPVCPRLGEWKMARAAFLPKALWDGPVVHDFEELNGLIDA